MQDVLNLLGISTALGLLFLAGPVAAVFFLQRRKRKARAERRSPLTEDLLRSAGHSLRARLDRNDEEINEQLVTLLTAPVCVVAVVLAIGHLRGTATMSGLVPMAALCIVAIFVYAIRKLLTTSARRDHLRKGYDAELAVGQELDQLMRQGASVFHDVPAEGFNIDHVVVSTAGIFAVETKGYAKPQRGLGAKDAEVIFNGSVLQFPTWTTSGPIEQAARQANWLRGRLASVLDSPTAVTPVVALPGWYVTRVGRGDVRVFSGKELKPHLLSSKGAGSLTPREVERASSLVERMCRTVSATYAPIVER